MSFHTFVELFRTKIRNRETQDSNALKNTHAWFENNPISLSDNICKIIKSHNTLVIFIVFNHLIKAWQHINEAFDV